jgi:hypothetical protein
VNGRTGFVATLLGLSLGAFGCSGRALPPRLPSTAIHDRTASRIALVDFVISDRDRARKVRALYLQIEQLMLETWNAETRAQAELGTSSLRPEAATLAATDALRDAELSALQRYVCVEVAIRALTTPEEFARLDAIK